MFLPNRKDIVDVILGEPGPKSNISQFREAQSKLSPRQRFRRDTGYQGEVNIETPHQQAKNRKLTSEEKDENQAFVQNRIYVEHLIRGIKIFRAIQQRFRLSGKHYSSVMKVIYGLVHDGGSLSTPYREPYTSVIANGVHIYAALY